MNISTAQVISQVLTWELFEFDGSLASHRDRASVVSRGKTIPLPLAGRREYGWACQEPVQWDANPKEIARLVRAADEVFFIHTTSQDGGRDDFVEGFIRDPANPHQWTPFYEECQ